MRPPIPLIHRNIQECVETGWRKLKAQGCKRVGSLLYEGDLYAHTRMAHAEVLLMLAMEGKQPASPPPLFLHYQGDLRPQIHDYLRAHRPDGLLAHAHRPDGLLAHSPYSARLVRESKLFQETGDNLMCLKLYPWIQDFPGFAFNAEGMIQEALRQTAGWERHPAHDTANLTLVSCPWTAQSDTGS